MIIKIGSIVYRIVIKRRHNVLNVQSSTFEKRQHLQKALNTHNDHPFQQQNANCLPAIKKSAELNVWSKTSHIELIKEHVVKMHALIG